MTDREREDLPTVLIRPRRNDLPTVDVYLGPRNDNAIWVEATQRGLYLGTRNRRFKRDVYFAWREEPARGPVVEVVDAANALLDQVEPAVQPVIAFMQRVHAANPAPNFAEGDPEISKVTFDDWITQPPQVGIFVRIGSRSGIMSVSDDEPRIFDAGLNLHLRAVDYRDDIQRMIGAAHPLIDAARGIARDMAPFMPPLEND